MTYIQNLFLISGKLKKKKVASQYAALASIIAFLKISIILCLGIKLKIWLKCICFDIKKAFDTSPYITAIVAVTVHEHRCEFKILFNLKFQQTLWKEKRSRKKKKKNVAMHSAAHLPYGHHTRSFSFRHIQ